MAEKKELCPWCKQTDFVCEGREDCDFKTLKKDKVAILERMKVEWGRYSGAVERIKVETDRKKQEALVTVAMDSMFGLNKMADALEREFGVARVDAMKDAGYKPPTFAEKLKLMSKMKQLRR
jgi:hypothetical protein